MINSTLPQHVGISFVPKNKIWFTVVMILSIGLVWAYYSYFYGLPYRYVRITVFGWISFVVILSVNLYSLRKYFIFRFYRKRIKTFQDISKSFEQAEQALRNLQREVSRGILKNVAEIKDKGNYLLKEYKLDRHCQTEIVVERNGEQSVRFSRKDHWGRLEFWLVYHIYIGFFILLACLVHADFSAGGAFVTKALFWLLLINLASGLVGIVISNYYPASLTRLETSTSLENIEFLRDILTKKLKEITQDRSPSFQKSLKKLRAFLSHSGTLDNASQMVAQIIETVPSEEQEAFKKAIVYTSQWRKVHLIAKSLRWYRLLQHGWLYIHIPISVAFMSFSLLHIFGTIYY